MFHCRLAALTFRLISSNQFWIRMSGASADATGGRRTLAGAVAPAWRAVRISPLVALRSD